MPKPVKSRNSYRSAVRGMIAKGGAPILGDPMDSRSIRVSPQTARTATFGDLLRAYAPNFMAHHPILGQMGADIGDAGQGWGRGALGQITHLAQFISPGPGGHFQHTLAVYTRPIPGAAQRAGRLGLDASELLAPIQGSSLMEAGRILGANLAQGGGLAAGGALAGENAMLPGYGPLLGKLGLSYLHAAPHWALPKTIENTVKTLGIMHGK